MRKLNILVSLMRNNFFSRWGNAIEVTAAARLGVHAGAKGRGGAKPAPALKH